MRREDIADLIVFQAVAEEGSFTAAANKLGLSQSALRHTVRRLETRLGVRLLNRTTRSVSLTIAGEHLLGTLQPALAEIAGRLAELTQLREQPAGTIRISASEWVSENLLWPAVERIVARYPDIHVEINVESGFIDIVSQRFDAGIRLGEAIDRDMVAVPIGPPLRMAAFASPGYVAAHGQPHTPQDLARHRCINMRFHREASPYAWEFGHHGRELRIRVEGALVVNRPRLVIAAALAVHGIGFQPEDVVQSQLDDGSLLRLLADWCPPFEGYHLYYPMRRQMSPAFRILVDALRYPA